MDKQIMKRWKYKLQKMSKEKLIDLLVKHDQTYLLVEGGYNKESLGIRSKVKTKEDIIEYIMNTKPVFSDGGLSDFLLNNGVVLTEKDW